MRAIVVALLFLICTSFTADTEPQMYSKEYYSNGQIKAEGWLSGTQKTKYWIFYHENGATASEGHFNNDHKTDYWHYYNKQGKLIKEGHYDKGIAQNWWIFYDIARLETRKIQYKDNQKNGFCLVYENKKLTKVEKYVEDQYKGEWDSVRTFRRDNPEVSLY